MGACKFLLSLFPFQANGIFIFAGFVRKSIPHRQKFNVSTNRSLILEIYVFTHTQSMLSINEVLMALTCSTFSLLSTTKWPIGIKSCKINSNNHHPNEKKVLYLFYCAHTQTCSTHSRSSFSFRKKSNLSWENSRPENITKSQEEK